MEKDVGTVLKHYPLGELGLIVVWCTQQHGLLHTAARGARKPGSRWGGRVDLFHECELVFKPAPSEEGLSTLDSVSLISPRLPLRRDLQRLRLAGYMARLLLCTVEPGAPDPAWHTLLTAARDYVATAPTPGAAILLRFEKRMAQLHGLYAPGTSPYSSLLRHFRHLPPDRNDLLSDLQG